MADPPRYDIRVDVELMALDGSTPTDARFIAWWNRDYIDPDRTDDVEGTPAIVYLPFAGGGPDATVTVPDDRYVQISGWAPGYTEDWSDWFAPGQIGASVTLQALPTELTWQDAGTLAPPGRPISAGIQPTYEDRPMFLGLNADPGAIGAAFLSGTATAQYTITPGDVTDIGVAWGDGDTPVEATTSGTQAAPSTGTAGLTWNRADIRGAEEPTVGLFTSDGYTTIDGIEWTLEVELLFDARAVGIEECGLAFEGAQLSLAGTDDAEPGAPLTEGAPPGESDPISLWIPIGFVAFIFAAVLVLVIVQRKRPD